MNIRIFGPYESGKLIYKDYRLIDYIGQGGYGKVYLVENQHGIYFALKVLLSDVHMEQQGFEAVKRIASPRLIKVFECGQTVIGEECILMEYAGEDLEQILSRRSPLEEVKACDWFIEILKSLQTLEDHGIIHRDLKPANLFLQDNIIKIGDFGTAKFTSGQSRMSQAALTYVYSAPERFGSNYDHAVDRWSAAVTFFRMLTGHFPFDGNDLQEVLGAINQATPDLSNLPSKYRLFLQTCFNWNPKDRYDSAEEMLSSFKRMLFEKESEASPHPIIDSTPEEKKLPQKVKEFTNSLGMDFVWIEPGAFMMGSPESETERNTNETQHKVILTKGFYLQTTVVTQGQWQAIMGTNIRQQRDTVDPSLELPGEDDLGINNYCSEGDNYPIYYVSWDEAQDFIRRLNRRTNKNYRLPTEAEWEYACRAGSTSRYCFGDSEELLQKYAWYEGNSDERVYKVALKQPNEWGLYDMHGNVDEWCNDYWSGDHPSDYVVDPTGPSGGSGHVLRGGSWRDSGRKCRSARRNRYVPHYRFDHLGFRLATSEPDVSEQKPETSSQIEIESTLKEKESPQLENKFTNSYGMDFVWIEPGTFMMGSPENELGRSENEAQHQVTLTNGFYMQTTVVTQGQWAAVMKNNPVINQGQWSAVLRNRLGAGRAQIGDDYPVVYVRWQDVQKFIRILNIKSFIHNFFSRKRYIYRLPTEAEWEYACRAGSTSRFYFGENEGELDEYVWYNGNRRSIYPHRVAQKKPNAWGLYDMQGNVDEWCCDWYEEYSSDSVVNPLGPICSLNDQRVIRGGSCFSHTHHCRSASRSRTRIFVNEETYTLGFRLVFSKWTRSKPT